MPIWEYVKADYGQRALFHGSWFLVERLAEPGTRNQDPLWPSLRFRIDLE